MANTITKILPPTRSGRTFFVASSLLGLGALLQLSLLGWYLAHSGARTVAATAAAAPAAPAIRFAETTAPTVASVDLPGMSVPAADLTNPTPAIPGGNAADPAGMYAVMPQPTPVPGQQLPGGAAGDALEQARALRQRGDMRAALGRLREALVAEPDNPQALAELAITYETMQLNDKAFEQWQRIYVMGETVGALYYLADAKLHGGASGTTAGTGRPAGAPGNQPAAADNTFLKITDLHTEDIPDPSVEKKIALKIVVKGRPGIVIDPDKVKIEAYFYDLLDGKDIVQTDAQTDYAWLTPPPINWANDKSEVLEALYVRPKAVALMPSPPAGAPRNSSRRNGRSGHGKSTPPPDNAEATATPADTTGPAPVRTYLGYSVRLYYDRQLQEVQADPVRLGQQFEAPLTLPAEEPARPPQQ